MKKMTLKMRLLGGLVIVSMALAAGSCAKGADCDEVYQASVTNAQLESPALDASCFETVTNADGSETAKFTWPIVQGGGGYEVYIANVNDPENPVVIIDEVIDGQTVSFSRDPETNWEIKVRTLGNEKLNNTEASDASTYAYTSWEPFTEIPVGTEISAFINANLENSEEMFRLIPGETYYLSGTADFNLTKKVLAGSVYERPTVIVEADGCLMTQAGLTIKNINFDCASRTSKGIITFSSTPEPSLHNQTGTLGLEGISRGAYVILDPISIVNCNFKDISNSFIYNNDQAWALYDFQIVNCILQFAYDGTNPYLIHFKKGNYSHVCYITIQNSTIFNTKDTKYSWVYYASNQNPDKIFGAQEKNVSVYKLANSTFYNPNETGHGDNMVKNTPSTGTHNIIWENNIFYNQNNPSKWIGSCKKTYTNNTVYRADGNDKSYDADVAAQKLDAAEDPAFVGPTDLSLDFDKPNGGVNFKPTGANALAGRRGDPRWFEEPTVEEE